MWFTHVKECRWSTVCCFVALLVGVTLVFLRIIFRLCVVVVVVVFVSAPSSWSWALVACIVGSTVVGLAVVVATIGVVGRIDCLSLPLTESLSMESHFKLSCVASQVVSFVKSLSLSEI